LVNDSKISEFSSRHLLKFTFQLFIKRFFIGDYAHTLMTHPVYTFITVYVVGGRNCHELTSIFAEKPGNTVVIKTPPSWWEFVKCFCLHS
jgi:hypothetical protein